MGQAIVGLCTLELYLPGVASLKEKRRIIKSIIQRLHNQFNVSAAETDFHDKWQRTCIAIATVSNTTQQAHKVIQSAVEFVETQYTDTVITNQEIEIL